MNLVVGKITISCSEKVDFQRLSHNKQEREMFGHWGRHSPGLYMAPKNQANHLGRTRYPKELSYRQHLDQLYIGRRPSVNNRTVLSPSRDISCPFHEV